MFDLSTFFTSESKLSFVSSSIKGTTLSILSNAAWIAIEKSWDCSGGKALSIAAVTLLKTSAPYFWIPNVAKTP